MDKAVLDTDRFRLRNFVDSLVQSDELEIVGEPIALADLAARHDCNPKATAIFNSGIRRREIL